MGLIISVQFTSHQRVQLPSQVEVRPCSSSLHDGFDADITSSESVTSIEHEARIGSDQIVVEAIMISNKDDSVIA